MADGSPPDPKLLQVSDLYREFGGYVARALRRFGVPEADLDDAVQETFLVAYRRLDGFEGRCQPRTWLCAIAVRVASSVRRSRRREAARREKAGSEVHGPGAPDPEGLVREQEAWDVLGRLLDELDDAKRTVFVLADLEGVKISEIARILGIKPNSVHARLRLARARFEAALHRYHAQERGRWNRATLLRHASSSPTPWTEERSHGVWAALVVELGRPPGVLAWLSTQSLASGLGSWSTGTWIALGLGTSAAALGLGFSLSLSRAPEPPRLASPTTVSVERAGEPSVPSPPATIPSDPEGLSLSLAEETRLLERARRAIQQQRPADALAAIEAHAAAYPDGLLAHERESSRLHALCLAGRRSEAIAWSEKLAAGGGNSVWTAVLAARCPPA